MREKIMYTLAAISAAIISWTLYKIAFVLPPDVSNVGAYQILYFHVPAFFTCFVGFFTGLVSSALYLKTGDLKYDSFAAGVNEVALVFASAGLAMGMIWGQFAWGTYWVWDARLTSMLICWLVYAGYLILRRSVEEPTARARFSAVLSIIGCIDITFVYKAIEWFRTQHPSPVLSIRNGGGMSPGLEAPIYWNWLGLVCLGAVLAMVRMRQEEVSREIDSLRRLAHSY